MKDMRIEVLLAVNETRSYTLAAKQLGISQPAVSQQIRSMEDEYGVKLFISKNRKIEPTNAGIIAIDYAKKIKSLFDKMNQDLDGITQDKYSLTIGFPNGTEGKDIAKSLALFASINPNIKISFVSSSISSLYSSLENYEIDLFVGPCEKERRGTKSLVLDSDAIVLAVNKDSALANTGIITKERLEQLSLLMLDESTTATYYVRNALADSALKTKVSAYASSPASLYELLEASDLPALTLQSAIRPLDKASKLVYIPVEGLTKSINTSIVYSLDFDHLEVLNGISLAYRQTKNPA